MNNPRASRPPFRGFTLVELLIVIVIFLILLAIAVPAFSSLLYTSEQSLAANSLRTGLSAARDAAVRSAEGQDAAAVFFYEPSSGHTQIITCIRAGEILDEPPIQGDPLIRREVFAPVPGANPVQLSRGWTVRGYAPANSIDEQWYGDNRSGNVFVSTGPARPRGNWLFPETAFFNDDPSSGTGNDGQDRQTFMVRFEGGTGIVKAADPSAVLILSPSTSTAFRTGTPWGQHRADTEPDPIRFVRRVVSAPATGGTGSLTRQQREQLLGGVSSDTVLAKPVGQLAVCSEKRLAQALGARLDPKTNSLYKDPTTGIWAPELVDIAGGPFTDTKLRELNDWIEGHLADPNSPTDVIESDCRIFTVQRSLGWLQEITGTTNGQGVGQ